MLKTTTEKIEGRIIEKYLGVVAGTDIYLVGGVFGGGMANQEKLYGRALDTAMSHLEEKAKNLGADAISTNLVSPGNVNNIIVVVTGTAVKTSYESKKESDNEELPSI